MKITLLLMSYKGYAVLEALLAQGQQVFIDKVIIGKDKNVVSDYADEIQKLCNDQGITYHHRNDNITIDSPYAIAVSWRWLIKKGDYKLIVLHDSLLPRYRGFAPLVTQLIKGEEEIGVTALFASSEYDRGDILLQKKLTITYPIKIEEAIIKISPLYAAIVSELVEDIQVRSLAASPQVEEKATYSIWRDSEDYFIDWQQSADVIKRFIDAVGYPYAGASTRLGEEIVKVIDAEEIQDVKVERRDCGKVIFKQEGCLVVICGEGLLKLTNAYIEKDKTPLSKIDKFRLRFS